jgi:hypothetical protein
VLDGLEVMEKKGAHRLLARHLAPAADPQLLAEAASRLEAHLGLLADEREARSEGLFRELAAFTATTLAQRLPALRPPQR